MAPIASDYAPQRHCLLWPSTVYSGQVQHAYRPPLPLVSSKQAPRVSLRITEAFINLPPPLPAPFPPAAGFSVPPPPFFQKNLVQQPPPAPWPTIAYSVPPPTLLAPTTNCPAASIRPTGFHSYLQILPTSYQAASVPPPQIVQCPATVSSPLSPPAPPRPFSLKKNGSGEILFFQRSLRSMLEPPKGETKKAPVEKIVVKKEPEIGRKTTPRREVTGCYERQCRSVYEETPDIPTFTRNENEQEAKRCELIFEILRSYTDMSLSMLFNELINCGGGNFTEEKELREFLEARPHLFTKTWKWQAVKNRGFGYRRGMVYLSCLILNKEACYPEGAKLTAIFEEAVAFPTYHLDDTWRDDYLWMKDLKEEDFLQFLRKNNQLYELTVTDPGNAFDTAYVKMKPSAKEIPSLWDSTLLPGVEDYSHRLEGRPFFDKSRSFIAVGFVSSSKGKHVKVNLSEGPFAGRKVFVEASEVNMEGKMEAAFPANSQVAMEVYFVLFSREHFRCSAIRPEHINENDDCQLSYDIPEEELEQVEKTQDLLILW